jgi:hypothetical protein
VWTSNLSPWVELATRYNFKSLSKLHSKLKFAKGDSIKIYSNSNPRISINFYSKYRLNLGKLLCRKFFIFSRSSKPYFISKFWSSGGSFFGQSKFETIWIRIRFKPPPHVTVAGAHSSVAGLPCPHRPVLLRGPTYQSPLPPPPSPDNTAALKPSSASPPPWRRLGEPRSTSPCPVPFPYATLAPATKPDTPRPAEAAPLRSARGSDDHAGHAEVAPSRSIEPFSPTGRANAGWPLAESRPVLCVEFPFFSFFVYNSRKSYKVLKCLL